MNPSKHARIYPTGEINRLLCECNALAQMQAHLQVREDGGDLPPHVVWVQGAVRSGYRCAEGSSQRRAGTVIVDKVKSGIDSGDEAEASEREAYESRCSTSSEKSRASDGDAGNGVMDWYVEHICGA